MDSPVRAIQKAVIPVVIAPLAIMLIASLLAYTYFYFTTGGFPPGLFERLLGLNPAGIYLLLSLCFGFAALVVVICGGVIHIAIEVHRIHKMMETHERIVK